MAKTPGNWLDPLGPKLDNSGPWSRPKAIVLQGQYCTLEPLSLETQADELWEEMTSADPEQNQWRYLAGMGPFLNQQQWVASWNAFSDKTDNQTFAVRVHATGRLTGQLSLLRIRPEHGSAEVGFVRFPPQMTRTRASTEAQFLLAECIFDQLGYRRYEWKCNDRNQASQITAKRLGFTYEGTFRNDMVNHGRNRDTAWWSILDHEWPKIKAGFQAWLSASNFDKNGQQIQRLEECR